MEEKSHVIPLDYIRGLIVAQGGRCAITGLPLDPQTVSPDHIIPLSRDELTPSHSTDNIWLVHKRVNTMKGTLNYDELVDTARMILEHEDTSRLLWEEIGRGGIRPVNKQAFDKWVEKNTAEDGTMLT